MSNIRVELAELQSAITALLAQYPELAEDEQLRVDTFEGLTDLHAIIERLVSEARDADTMAEAIKLRKQALGERQARIERKSEAMRTLILGLMERADLKKLPLPEATISVGFRGPAPVVFDDAALPDNCVTVVRKPDMAAIREAIKEGAIPGVRMTNGKNILSIRVK